MLSEEKVFFTSDLHLFHSNIIKYCERPFSNVDEMNDTLIRNWNNVVPEDGEVYILGDIGVWYGRNGIVDDVLNTYEYKLNGKKHLILGNHDSHFNKHKLGKIFGFVTNRLEMNFDVANRKQFIVMDHYPMISWNKSFHGSWQLFGHIHTNKGQTFEKNRLITSQYDVGVDNNDYTPVSLKEIDVIITKQILNGGK